MPEMSLDFKSKHKPTVSAISSRRTELAVARPGVKGDKRGDSPRKIRVKPGRLLKE